MIKKAIGMLLACAGVFLLYVGLQPSTYEISREIAIAAPARKVFPFINVRSLANSWNPWLRMDPTLKLKLSGPESGVGSRTSWSGGKELGVGSATVTGSVPDKSVTVRLDYEEPFKMTQEAVYLLAESNGQTTVTWKVHGKKGFTSKLMCTFMDMDKMVGDTFLMGLADLKARIEKPKS